VVAVPFPNSGNFVALQADSHISARLLPHSASMLPEFGHFSQLRESG